MKNLIKPIARKQSLVIQESGSEILIYDLDTNKAVCLNETSALIWQACDGKRSVSDISILLSKQFNSITNDDFVWLALDQLKKENLIENSVEIVVDFKDLTRREVIRKVGLSSIIALPMVSSLIAPLAAHAQSTTCGNVAAGSCRCSGNTAVVAGTTCVTTGNNGVSCPVGQICQASTGTAGIGNTCGPAGTCIV